MKHPDLAGRTVAGHDFIYNDANPADDQGHGTKSTGVLGAASNNATGVAGTCWTCALLPVKVLDSSNYDSRSAISNGIVRATDKGAKVISMSIYGKSGSSTAQRREVRLRPRRDGRGGRGERRVDGAHLPRFLPGGLVCHRDGQRRQALQLSQKGS